jgi:uncharacterized protein (TIGR03437 family)
MRLQNLYYTSSRKYSEMLIATLAALVALMLVAALDRPVAAQNSIPANARALSAVSAASFSSNEVAPESIVAAFGNELATSVKICDTWPLPMNLAGTSVNIHDAVGNDFDAPLFFVAPSQVNFYLPPQVAKGEATVTVTSGDGSLSVGVVNVVDYAPGLFSMNGNGGGVAAGTALRIRGSAYYFEVMARFDLETNQWVTLPIEPGPTADRLFIAFYGTGIRGRASLSEATATLGGEPVTVSYAGAQGNLYGVDQVNIEVPRELMGRGEVDFVLRINGKDSNVVKVSLK